MFGTAAALRVFMGRPELDDVAAISALNDVTGFIRAVCDQTISLVTNDVEVIEVDRFGPFVLSQFPVVAVTQVESQDSTGSWVTWDANSYFWLRSGIVRPSGFGAGRFTFPQPFNGRVRVTYDHGYATIDDATPPGLMGVVMSMAARRLSNPLERLSVTLGGFSESFQRSTTGTLLATEHELAIIRAFRSVSVG